MTHQELLQCLINSGVRILKVTVVKDDGEIATLSLHSGVVAREVAAVEEFTDILDLEAYLACK